MNSQSGTDISQLEPLLNSDGLEEAMNKSVMLFVVGSAADRAASKFAVAKQSAEQFAIRADRAVELREEKATAAEAKAAAASQAAKAAVKAEQNAEVQHQQLLEVLAAKKRTTVAAEAAAEQRRQQEAEEKARLERLEQERAQAAVPNPPSKPAATTPSNPAPTPNPPSNPPSTGGSGGGGGGGGGGGETPAPPPAAGAEAGLAAVAWARQQIGKPYQWGGSGPSSFDCSGLTSQAWLRGGGKAIPRVAADQYYFSTKIPYNQMRPGDLIFWGSDLHHVAMYSGNGMMIEAQRSGTNIHEIPIRWSGTVKYAGRV
jgi:cell wall-associated NlpC family hydrolase